MSRQQQTRVANGLLCSRRILRAHVSRESSMIVSGVSMSASRVSVRVSGATSSSPLEKLWQSSRESLGRHRLPLPWLTVTGMTRPMALLASPPRRPISAQHKVTPPLWRHHGGQHWNWKHAHYSQNSQQEQQQLLVALLLLFAVERPYNEIITRLLRMQHFTLISEQIFSLPISYT